MTVSWSDMSSYLIYEAKKKRALIDAHFELTSRCNFQCKMCYVCKSVNNSDARKDELTTAEWIEMGRHARDAGLLFLTLTGGEIFVRDDFREIYSGLLELGLNIQLYTNGSMITPEIISYLKSMPPFKVSITLYGADEAAYKRVTGVAGGYQRTVNAIDMLIEAGILVELKTTVIKGNENDFTALADFAKSRGLSMGIVNYISPRREGDNSDPVGNRLSPPELVEYECGISQRNRELQLQGSSEKIGSSNDNGIADTLQTDVPDGEEIIADPFHCTAGKCGTWITWDGRMVVCGLMNMPGEKPLETGFSVAWENLKTYCEAIPACETCNNCKYRPFCERCPARLMSETGHFDMPAPYLCETAKLRYERKVRI